MGSNKSKEFGEISNNSTKYITYHVK